jgi:hypothetical protein
VDEGSDEAVCPGCGREPGPIQEPVRWRVLRDPESYVPFRVFCCGKTRRSEYEVALTIHNLWAQKLETPQVAVLLEKDTPADSYTGQRPLVGVSTVVEHPVPLEVADVPGYAETDEGAAIGVIGTDLVYRGRPLRDGKTRPGNVLLEATLEVIQTRFHGAMPFVKAHVLPNNAGSKRLFDEHGFDSLGLGGGPAGDQLTVFRGRYVPVSLTREPSWSLA